MYDNELSPRICVFSALRIVAVVRLDPLDFTYSSVPDIIYGGLEVQLGIINACLPMLQPLVSKAVGANSKLGPYISRVFRTRESYRSYSNKKFNPSAESTPKKFHRLGDDSILLESRAGAEADQEQESREHFDDSEVRITRHVDVYRSQNEDGPSVIDKQRHEYKPQANEQMSQEEQERTIASNLDKCMH